MINPPDKMTDLDGVGLIIIWFNTSNDRMIQNSWISAGLRWVYTPLLTQSTPISAVWVDPFFSTVRLPSQSTQLSDTSDTSETRNLKAPYLPRHQQLASKLWTLKHLVRANTLTWAYEKPPCWIVHLKSAIQIIEINRNRPFSTAILILWGAQLRSEPHPSFFAKISTEIVSIAHRRRSPENLRSADVPPEIGRPNIPGDPRKTSHPRSHHEIWWTCC